MGPLPASPMYCPVLPCRYYEKYYFSPSCEPFAPVKVCTCLGGWGSPHAAAPTHPALSLYPILQTAFGTLGVMVCWDQWFPEAARAQALQGAEVGG